MKMLFFSADPGEVGQVQQVFQETGIPCEIRNSTSPLNPPAKQTDAELWIRDDRDCHRAFMLCVQREVGFAKRWHVLDIFDLDSRPDQKLPSNESHNRQ